jgi:hypothetical protein
MRKRMVAVFVLVIGLGAMVAGFTMRSASSTARGWPVASGKITERTTGPSTTSGASRPGRYFEPRVTYSYTVDGKPYQGHRIGLSTDGYDQDKAQRVADGLPERVDVYYNPRDPSDALLSPGSSGSGILLLILGALGLLIGAAMLYGTFTKP